MICVRYVMRKKYFQEVLNWGSTIQVKYTLLVVKGELETCNFRNILATEIQTVFRVEVDLTTTTFNYTNWILIGFWNAHSFSENCIENLGNINWRFLVKLDQLVLQVGELGRADNPAWKTEVTKPRAGWILERRSPQTNTE